MTDLTKLANIAEIFGALIVVGGLIFAVLQMRNFRQQRRELAAIEVFRSFSNPHLTRAYTAILNLPDGLSASELEAQYPGYGHYAMLISTTMENIGVMTFQRIVPYLVVRNLIGTTTVVLWGKLQHWVGDLRTQADNKEAFEWSQWLAGRFEECIDPDELPAYEAFKSWKPTRLTNEM